MRARHLLVCCLLHTACFAKPTPPPPAAVMPAEPPPIDALARSEFNLRAVERFQPIFWRSDANHDGKLEPDELSVLWGPEHAQRGDYVGPHGFTPALYDAYHALLTPFDDSALSASERHRRELVRRELRNGSPTLVETDLSTVGEEDRAIVMHAMTAGALIERIYARQLGTLDLRAQLPPDDRASQALFNRNQGPWCVTPGLEHDPDCNALPSRPPHRSGLYPADLQADAKFCDALAAQPNAKDLMGHFSTVARQGAGYRVVPYNEAYREDSSAVALELEALAASIHSMNEAPLQKYARAAAQAFRDNDWEPANQAWLEMGGSSSRYYLRVAPDEVYYDPCGWKAGYALTLAHVNGDSQAWQAKLAPVKERMEEALARLAGPPYKARKVAFRLPDFIDIIVNAGDQRSPEGATIGDSLPNWGPVADRGGRTVAMVNLYTDADSRETLGKQMGSLFCAATARRATTDPKPSIMSTVLHEASHNLGPSHDYAVGGKKDSVLFGGSLASTLEELKAQTAALYFADWLAAQKVITVDEAQAAHVRDVAWAFGHISRGMYEGDGRPKNYSQLASIQMGSLWKAGVLAWHAEEKAAGGDVGCFELDLARWPAAIDALASRVLRVKARGDRKDAEAMKAAFVDAKDEWARLKQIITERWLRAPKASFVYGVR